MKVLIPLVSKKENNPEFLQKATEGAKEAILLVVIDKSAMVGQFGFAASEIMQGNALIEQIRKSLEEKGKRVKDIEEWGDTAAKIENTALLQRADRIALFEQENEYFKNLVKELSKKLGKKVETIKITPPAEKEGAKKDNPLGIGKA